jgi:hypothetical protein
MVCRASFSSAEIRCVPSVRTKSDVCLQFGRNQMCAFSSAEIRCVPSVRPKSDVCLQFEQFHLCALNFATLSFVCLCSVRSSQMTTWPNCSQCHLFGLSDVCLQFNHLSDVCLQFGQKQMCAFSSFAEHLCAREVGENYHNWVVRACNSWETDGHDAAYE